MQLGRCCNMWDSPDRKGAGSILTVGLPGNRSGWQTEFKPAVTWWTSDFVALEAIGSKGWRRMIRAEAETLKLKWA